MTRVKCVAHCIGLALCHGLPRGAGGKPWGGSHFSTLRAGASPSPWASVGLTRSFTNAKRPALLEAGEKTENPIKNNEGSRMPRPSPELTPAIFP